MKKILMLILIVCLAFVAKAQTYQNPLLYGETKNRIRTDSVLQLPIGLTGSNNGLRTALSLPAKVHGYDTAQLRYNIADSSVRVWTGYQFLVVGGGGGVGYGRFGVSGEDERATGGRTFYGDNNTYPFTFDSVNTFAVRRDGVNRYLMNGGATYMYSPDGTANALISDALNSISINSEANFLKQNTDSMYTPKRISYTSNINGSLTANSLVTKRYVDSVSIVGTVTGTRFVHGNGSGGLTTTANFEMTGGFLADMQYVRSNQHYFWKDNVTDANAREFGIMNANNTALDSSVALQFGPLNSSHILQKVSFYIDRFGHTIYGDGNFNQTGLAKYYSNRSSSYDDRTLVDKRYVDSSITAGGGGTGSNLSWDAANHQVDIDGGGTSATIPYATGSADGLMSFASQTFGGAKTFNSTVNAYGEINRLDPGGNTVVTLGMETSGPNYGGGLILHSLGANVNSLYSATSLGANRTNRLPNADGTLVVSVNGNTADAAGNVVISGGGETFQQTLDLETGEAVTNKHDTIAFDGYDFHFINDNSVANNDFRATIQNATKGAFMQVAEGQTQMQAYDYPDFNVTSKVVVSGGTTSNIQISTYNVGSSNTIMNWQDSTVFDYSKASGTTRATFVVRRLPNQSSVGANDSLAIINAWGKFSKIAVSDIGGAADGNFFTPNQTSTGNTTHDANYNFLEVNNLESVTLLAGASGSGRQGGLAIDSTYAQLSTSKDGASYWFISDVANRRVLMRAVDGSNESNIEMKPDSLVFVNADGLYSFDYVATDNTVTHVYGEDGAGHLVKRTVASMGGTSYTANNGVRLSGTTFKLDDGSNPLTDNVNINGITNSKRVFISGKGSGNSGVDIYGEGSGLLLGSNASTQIYSSGIDSASFFIAARTLFNSNPFTTSFTIADYKDAPEIDLKQIGSNQTITFVPANTNGYLLLIHNQNTSAFSWLTSGPVVEPDGTPITAIPNESMSWYKFDGVSGSATQGYWVHFTDNTGGGGVSDGDKGDITVSSSGATYTDDYRRGRVITTSTATDANITAVAGTAYNLPPATLSTGRTIDVSGLNANGDYIELYNNEEGFLWSFTGATVYDSDGVTAITELLINANSVVRRVNSKLMISKL